MKSIFYGSLFTASAIITGCVSQDENGKNGVSGCWQVIETNTREAGADFVDTGSLELTQSGSALNGYVSWSKWQVHFPDSVTGVSSGDSLSLRVVDMARKDTLELAGDMKNENGFDLTLSTPKPYIFNFFEAWAGTRISCRMGK